MTIVHVGRIKFLPIKKARGELIDEKGREFYFYDYPKEKIKAPMIDSMDDLRVEFVKVDAPADLKGFVDFHETERQWAKIIKIRDN